MPRLFAFLLVFFGVSLSACDSSTPDAGPATIPFLARDTPSLTTLYTALEAADLVNTLDAVGSTFTVFAPTNAAFQALPSGELNRLLQPANRAELQSVLTYHVVPGVVRAADLTNGQILTTVQGARLVVNITGGVVRVNGVAVTTPDVEAENGVVHIVEGVLLPPAGDIVALASATPSLSTLVTAVGAAGLVSTLQGDGPFTVFAPDNAAFGRVQSNLLTGLLGNTAQLTDLLTYHVVPGKLFAADLTDGQVLTTVQGQQISVAVNSGGVFVDGVRVTAPNINATNGVVHVVEDVLIKPIDIVDAAGILGFTSLAGALESANLITALRGAGPFTVFAPTNEAFAAANAGGLTTAQLTNILLYHVANGAVRSTALSNNQVVPTLLTGESVTIRIAGTTITIDGAQADGNVTVADVVVSNGVIHAVDGVLLPSAF
jgi:transforming growth factor-beta-induced protein